MIELMNGMLIKKPAVTHQMKFLNGLAIILCFT